MKLSSSITLLTIIHTAAAQNNLRGRTLAEELQIQSERERKLQTIVEGPCTAANFAAKLGGQEALATLLGTGNTEAEIQRSLDEKCKTATEATVEFGEITYRGRQFDKAFFDGETSWNEQVEKDGNYVLAQDAGRVKGVYDAGGATTVFKWPGDNAYFSNFKDCSNHAVTCCYVAARLNGETDPEDNTDVCAVDLAAAPKTNHIQASGGAYTVFNAKEDDKSYCTGFVYGDADSFSSRVKGTTLFTMSMYDMLYTKGYVRPVPGAPMCGCIEQMPFVSNSACVETKEGYKVDTDGNVSVHMGYGPCTETSLSAKADAMAENKVVPAAAAAKIKELVGSGDCEKATEKFMGEKFLVKTASS